MLLLLLGPCCGNCGMQMWVCSLLFKAAHLQRCLFGCQMGVLSCKTILGRLSLGLPPQAMPSWQWLEHRIHALLHVQLHFLEAASFQLLQAGHDIGKVAGLRVWPWMESKSLEDPPVRTIGTTANISRNRPDGIKFSIGL